MEYMLNKEKDEVCDIAFEGNAEQPVDIELSLPDYCPDIERILKCRICPSITSKSLVGDRLEIEGTAAVILYYLDAKKQSVRICEHSCPFSCGFGIKPELKAPVAVVKTRTDYVNCRAVSPRKADIHGAFTVSATVFSAAEQETCTGLEGDDIQQRTHNEAYSRLCSTGQQIFSITETLDIGQGRSAPENILRSELSLITEGFKALENKLMISGEAVLRLLYVTDTENGSTDTMTFSVPFTQVIDAQGLHSEAECEIMTEVMSYEVTLKSEFDESSTLINLDARVCVTVIATENAQTCVIDDAYSTAYEMETTRTQKSFSRLISLQENDISVKNEVSIGENGITHITDLWCDSVSLISAVDKEKLTIKGKLLCCILAVDNEGVPFYAERPLEFAFCPETPEDHGRLSVRVNASPASLSFRITGENSVELKAELRINSAVFEDRSVSVITAAQYNEDKKRIRDKAAALTLYYADAGEELWQIARAYCTSVEALKQENELTEESLAERSMLLIPM